MRVQQFLVTALVNTWITTITMNSFRRAERKILRQRDRLMQRNADRKEERRQRSDEIRFKYGLLFLYS